MSIICMGEVVADFIALESGKPLDRVRRFERCLGGSPVNVVAGLRHLGLKATVWSRVGADATGRFVLTMMDEAGLETGGITVDPVMPTRLILIGEGTGGERLIEVHNRRSADQFIELGHLPEDGLSDCRIFHISGTTLLGDVTAQTTSHLIRGAGERGTLVSMDPNIRPREGAAGDLTRQRLRDALRYVDVLKMNKRDWEVIWGRGVAPGELIESANLQLLVLTDGEKGATWMTRTLERSVPARSAWVVDPTGAGDAYQAALLSALSRRGRSGPIEEGELIAWGSEAAELSARVTEHLGGTGYYLQHAGHTE